MNLTEQHDTGAYPISEIIRHNKKLYKFCVEIIGYRIAATWKLLTCAALFARGVGRVSS